MQSRRPSVPAVRFGSCTKNGGRQAETQGTYASSPHATRRVSSLAKPCLLLRRSGKRHCTPSERTESCRHGPRHLRVNRAAHRLAFVAALLRRPRLSSASPARKIRANRLSGDQKGKSRPQCRGAVALRSHQRANPEDRLPSSIGILLEATGDDAIEPEQSLVPRFLARHDRPANPA